MEELNLSLLDARRKSGVVRREDLAPPCAAEDVGPPMSNRFTLPLLDLVEDQLGRRGLERLVDETGLRMEEIRDPEGWIPSTHAARLNELAIERTGDSDIVRKAGEAAFSSARYLGPMYHIARGLGASGILHTFRFLADMDLFRRNSEWTLDRMGKGQVDFTWRPRPGVFNHPTFCQFRVGALEAIPRLSDLPSGRVEHLSCTHDGGDACRYRVWWVQAPNVGWLLLLFGGLLIAASAAVNLRFTGTLR